MGTGPSTPKWISNMKKHTKKPLSLNTETIRSLTDGDLAGIAGGVDTRLCPNTKGCPFPVLTDGCPKG
jgi:hypothetical protein